MNLFKDRVVIVTGGSSGIGRAAALRFATLGGRVLITGRRAESLEGATKDHPNLHIGLSPADLRNICEK